MSKTTKELKDAVEARIDVEQRRQIVQILSREGMLDEQMTEKLQRLMREVERREELKGKADGTEPVAANDEHELEASPPFPQPIQIAPAVSNGYSASNGQAAANGQTASNWQAVANGHAIQNEHLEQKPQAFLHPMEAVRPTEAPPSAKEISSREKFAELERKNLEMSQALEQMTKEKENLFHANIPHHDTRHDDELAYRLRNVTSKFDKDESSWMRIYWPIIAVIFLVGVAAWIFFKFAPLWSTL